MLRNRLLTAIVFIPFAALVVGLGGWWFFTLALVCVVITSCEYVNVINHGQGYRRCYTSTYLLTVVMVIVLMFNARFRCWSLLGTLLSVSIMLSLGWQVIMFEKGNTRAFTEWAVAAGGGLYLGFLSGHAVMLRDLPDGLSWIVVAFAVTWIADTGAYFVGRAMGSHKLCPNVSPKKTWEGFVGGALSGILAGGVVGAVAMWGNGSVGVFHGIILGILIVPAALFGDLAVSMIKRQSQVKDAGDILPGHGGLFDRLDSTIFSVVVAYYYVVWFVQ